MTNEKSSMNVYKQINWKIMIPIMLFVTFQSAFTAFSSVLASIAEQFPHASATTIQMVLTLPSTMSIPVSLCAGLLASYFTKKQMIEFSLVVEFIGGMIPLVNHTSLGMLILSSCLIGLGQGIMITMASAIVGENFIRTDCSIHHCDRISGTEWMVACILCIFPGTSCSGDHSHQSSKRTEGCTYRR